LTAVPSSRTGSREASEPSHGHTVTYLPGDSPQPYAVYVDESDAVWVSDWGANAILRFDPKTEKFESFPLPDYYASVRQLAGRKGEVWGAESRADKLFVLKSE
jgi:virginiamycin B lyase